VRSFETVVFIAANFQQGLIPAFGALAGLAGAVGIGVLLFKWASRLTSACFPGDGRFTANCGWVGGFGAETFRRRCC